MSFGTCGFESHPPHRRHNPEIYSAQRRSPSGYDYVDGQDDRPPHRRRRLPGPERGDPRRRPELRRAGWDAVGVLEGWRGLVDGRFKDLGPQEVSGILPRGGTIIGTSRTNPYKLDGGVEKVLQNFRDRELDALVAIGGEDTLGVAARLFEEHDFPVVGVPKTIDNDLSGTDYTFGFDTAVRSRPRRSTGCTRRPSRTTA